MRRREFVKLLAGSATPLPARAQQSAARVYRIGVLAPFPPGGLAGFLWKWGHDQNDTLSAAKRVS
jgi:hypothetical protein